MEAYCEYCYNKGYVTYKDLRERELTGRLVRRERNKAWRDEEINEWCEKVKRIMRDESVDWEGLSGDVAEGRGEIIYKEVKIEVGGYEVMYMGNLQ